MITIEELSKCNSLGTKEEIEFVLFDALSSTTERLMKDLRSFCVSRKYAIGNSLDGIISLLEYVGFIEKKRSSVKLKQQIFQQINLSREGHPIILRHLCENFLITLAAEEKIHRLFNSENVHFDRHKGLYFVRSHLVPFRSFVLRNILMSLDFLRVDQENTSCLLIENSYRGLFERLVVNQLDKEQGRGSMSIGQLKAKLTAQERLGREAEIYVLGYEKQRLEGHPFISKIRRIADDNVGAGYDIISFTGMSSIVPNRFIEVKSYNDDVVFYWSKNEASVAKELGSNYFLYLIDRQKMHLDSYVPMMIKNPYKRIFEDGLWKTNPENWKVTLVSG